jgi:uncharacterized membrane protein
MDLSALYPFVVFLHVAAAFTFAVAHGVSAFAAFRIRQERDPGRIAALLDLSAASLGTMYAGLGVLLLAGIAAGMMGGWFGRGWIWASLGILVLVVFAMYGLAARYYRELRQTVGASSQRGEAAAQPGGEASPRTAVTREELDRMLDTRRPDAIAAVGITGLIAIVFLMVVKPF